MANKYSSYLLTFFCLDDAQPCHDIELSLRNEDLPVDWESKMSQMLCFPSFRGVVGQPIVIAGHTRSGTASHVQVNELKMVGRLHAGSSRFDHGCDMRRWFNEIMLKTVCFCIGNPQIDFPRFRFPSDIVLTGHFDCYSYPQGA